MDENIHRVLESGKRPEISPRFSVELQIFLERLKNIPQLPPEIRLLLENARLRPFVANGAVLGQYLEILDIEEDEHSDMREAFDVGFLKLMLESAGTEIKPSLQLSAFGIEHEDRSSGSDSMLAYVTDLPSLAINAIIHPENGVATNHRASQYYFSRKKVSAEEIFLRPGSKVSMLQIVPVVK